METLAIVRLAIANGELEPAAADLGREIVTKYGAETFRYFLLYRNAEAKRPRTGPLTPKRRPLAR